MTYYPANQPPSQPPYYPKAPMPPQPVPQTNSMAVVSLIFGILSYLGLAIIGAIIAIIAGHVAKGQIRASNGWQTGDGMATAGLVMGYIQIVLLLCGCVFVALILLVPAFGAAVYGLFGYNY